MADRSSSDKAGKIMPSSQQRQQPPFSHGPENAEHELRKAYNCVIEASVTHFWDRKDLPGVRPEEVVQIYKHAFNAYREGDRLAAERWARSAKHLSRALWHEAKLAYLEKRSNDLPFILGAQPEEYHLHEHSDTTEDLINSVAEHVPPGLDQMPEEMKRYIGRARKHLEFIEDPAYTHELLRAERIKAAHEYGRLLECLALAYEAENPQPKKSAA